MLTEEMFAALIEAVRNAKRVIFVGDPNQLPPIGTGKPFYDLVQMLKSQDEQPHYANLLVSNRQKQGGTSNIRLDVELSKLFADDLMPQVQDDLFAQISLDSTNIEFIGCKDAEGVPLAIQQAFRSKSEVIVYDMLYDAGFKPLYEQKIILDGIPVRPDFSIEQASGTVYWEHLGMLGDYMYRKNWERKKKLYAENNISEEAANLILSQDELSGAIDAEKISDIIANKLKVDWSKVIETGLESKYLNSIYVQGFAAVIRSKYEKLLRSKEADKNPSVTRYSQLSGRELIEFALSDFDAVEQNDCYKYWRALNELIHNDMSEVEKKTYPRYSLEDKRALLKSALAFYLKTEKA